MLSGAYGLSSSTVLQIAGKVPNTHGIMLISAADIARIGESAQA